MPRSSLKRLASNKRYREAHKEARAAYAKAYYARRMAADPTYNSVKCKAYQSKNKDKVRAYKKSHLARSRKMSALWRQNNPEKWRTANNIRSKRFSKRNPERSRELKANATAKRKAVAGQLSYGIAKKLMLLQGRKCALCQEYMKKFHIDHIMPLARGGLHEDSNIQLLCPPCNLRKSSRHPIEFSQSIGKLL